MQNKKNKTRKLTQMALLTAIILLMAFTPLGYLRTGVVEITFIMIPVVVGAILMGPGAGAILGGVFGLTSFIQCFGMSALGAMLLQVNWFFTFVVCFVPRVLMGWLAGLIFKALYKVDKTRLVSFAVASLSGAVLNTIFFVGSALCLLLNLFRRVFSRHGGRIRDLCIGVFVVICNAEQRAGVCGMSDCGNGDQQGAV